MSKGLRSQDWFGRKDKDGIIYRSWMKNQGMPVDMCDGRPAPSTLCTWMVPLCSIMIRS